jgi:hypothetical protein
VTWPEGVNAESWIILALRQRLKHNRPGPFANQRPFLNICKPPPAFKTEPRWTELVGWTMEVPGEVLDGADVTANGSWGRFLLNCRGERNHAGVFVFVAVASVT